MKSVLSVLALSLSFVLAAAGAARADLSALDLTSLPAKDFAFCVNTDATVILTPQLATEVGVVITNVGNSMSNTSGTIAVAADNFYGKGAGAFWKSGMGNFNLPGGNCYNVATMGKATSPNPNSPWTCALTSGAAVNAGANFSGVMSTQTQPEVVATGFVVSGISQFQNDAPVINCQK
ncbi:hypothetical protein [Radicibacter daui]|uniref:hypothetical protein n=1 Tax=Radicibacter daui TaxID=3064829 RepID=UPI004046AF6B